MVNNHQVDHQRRRGEVPSQKRFSADELWALSPEQVLPRSDIAKPGNATKQLPLKQSNKAINRHITKAAEQRDPKSLLQTIHQHLPDMNGINLATAFHRVAKLASAKTQVESIKRNPMFQELFDAIVAHISHHSLRIGSVCQDPQQEMPVQSMSIVTWSCANMQINHKALLADLAEIVTPWLDELAPYELSNLTWAFAKLNASTPILFNAVVMRLLRRQKGEFPVQYLSTIAWAFATSRRKSSALFGSLAPELLEHAHQMKPQELANALWAYAKIRRATPELFQGLGDAAAKPKMMDDFKPQELSNITWAFATAGIKHPRLFAQVEIQLMRRRNEMMPQNIANLIWSYAKLELQPSSAVFQVLLELSMKTLPQHKPEELSAVIWAASEIAPRHKKFFAMAARCCMSSVRDFSANALANLAKAFSKLEMVEADMPEMFEQIMQVSLTQLPQFNAAALCNLLQGALEASMNPVYLGSQARLKCAVSTICEHIAERIKELQPSELELLSSLLSQQSQEDGACNRGFIQVLSTEKLRQQEVSSGAAPKTHAGSIGSVSTSAEESQSDAEDDDSEASDGHLQSLGMSPVGNQLSQAVQAWSAASAFGRPVMLPDQQMMLRCPGASGLPYSSLPSQKDFQSSPWHVPLPAPYFLPDQFGYVSGAHLGMPAWAAPPGLHGYW